MLLASPLPVNSAAVAVKLNDSVTIGELSFEGILLVVDTAVSDVQHVLLGPLSVRYIQNNITASAIAIIHVQKA
jgi:hypothetical protein